MDEVHARAMVLRGASAGVQGLSRSLSQKRQVGQAPIVPRSGDRGRCVSFKPLGSLGTGASQGVGFDVGCAPRFVCVSLLGAQVLTATCHLTNTRNVSNRRTRSHVELVGMHVASQRTTCVAPDSSVGLDGCGASEMSDI